MASFDNWSVSDKSNMLRILTKTANYTFARRELFSKIQPALCSTKNNNLFTTPPSFENVQKLPKLPVPVLKDTLQKYLTSIKPLLTSAEFEKSTRLADEFGKNGGCGEKLQKLLEERAKKSENWMDPWWLHTAYLGYRLPVVVHSSPGLVFPLQKFCSLDERLNYAAKLIVAAMKYKEEIDCNKIPLEKMGKAPLDMGQYKKFFGTCRIPKKDLDGIEYNPKSTHIVVACNNHFFKLNTMTLNGEILNKCQILKQLCEIYLKSTEKTDAIGILSSDQRDSWAKNYSLLTLDCGNRKSVREIQKALFLVCLDGPMPDPSGINRLTQAGHQCIHGGGSKYNGGNRWFDKTVQFIVGCDGIVGLTYEHSPSEGQPIAVMTDFLVNNMDKFDLPAANCVDDFEQLCFNVTPDIKNAIKQAGQTLDCLVDDFDLECHVYENYGKEFVKSNKLSPDSYIQMAMQYAYYKMYCKPAPHYESAAVRQFYGGRTETIRSCSCESVQFAKKMLTDCTPNEKRDAMIAAVNSHKKYTVAAVNGLGVDRHFLGLKLIAKENGIEISDFFKDKGFTESVNFRLTSSQVATKCPGFMCYGAVVPDGYGICYNPRADNMFYGISCFKTEKSTDVKKMKEVFESCFNDMRDVLCKAQKSKL